MYQQYVGNKQKQDLAFRRPDSDPTQMSRLIYVLSRTLCFSPLEGKIGLRIYIQNPAKKLNILLRNLTTYQSELHACFIYFIINVERQK